MGQIVEIRTYTLKAGLAGQFHKVMQELAVPLLRATGTDVVTARPSLHEDDTYVLIRSYLSLAQRAGSQQEFYGSAVWLQGPRDAIMACIEHYTTAVLSADETLLARLRASGTQA